jgi:phage-related tail fiber protein
MATFNAELAAKTLERRVTGLESAHDASLKQSRAAGDVVATVATLQKQLAEQRQRIETLEKLVKTLMETRGDSKAVALDAMKVTLKDIEAHQKAEQYAILDKMGRDSAARFDLGMRDVVRKPELEKFIREQLDQTSKALHGVSLASSKRNAEEARREIEAAMAEQQRRAEAQIEQAMKSAARIQQDLAEKVAKTIVDSQFSILSARLGAVEGRLKA